MTTATTVSCDGCRASAGHAHARDCTMARCPACGRQRIRCTEHAGRDLTAIWTGQCPGVIECQEFGWWCRNIPGLGWTACTANTPGATEDLNRLYAAAAVEDVIWNADLQRFTRPPAPAHQTHPA